MGQQLKIAELAEVWFPVPADGYGGAEEMIAALANGLVDLGHDVTVICAGANRTRAKTLITLEEAQGLHITQGEPAGVHAAIANKLIEEHDFDVIHDHTWFGPATAGLRRPVTVATTHCLVTGKRGLYYEALSERARLVSISYDQRSSNDRLNWLTTIHNAIEVSEWPFSKEKQQYALFLGRCHPDKGIAQAIQAAMAAEIPIKIAAKCHEPIEVAYYETVIVPLLKAYPDAEWLGEVTGEAKKELLKNALCLLAPGQWREPYGMVYIEAMVCGTPVVAMECGAASEIITNGVTGYICTSVNALPNAIHMVWNIDPVMCRLEVEDRFSAPVMAAAYERAFYKAISLDPPDLIYRQALLRAEAQVADVVAGYRNSLRLKSLELNHYKNGQVNGHVGTKSRTSTPSR